MRAAVEAMGGDVGELKGGIARLEPHLEDVTRVAHPLRRLNPAAAAPGRRSVRRSSGLVLLADARARRLRRLRRRVVDRPRRRPRSRRPKETREPLPERPKEWEPYVNERGGYALLLPRGWKAEADGPQTLIRSYDRLVAISIAPDRSPRRGRPPIEDYATNTADELRGFEDGFDAKGMRPFDHRYDAVEVFGTGTSRDGVDQRASVIVLRRGELATVTVVLAANAKPGARESVRIARRAIATLRTRPPEALAVRPLGIDVVDRDQGLERAADRLRRSPRRRRRGGRRRRRRRRSPGPARGSARPRRSSSRRW